jgi:hypothetical protein
MIRSLPIFSPCLLLAAISPAQTDAPKEHQTQSVQGKVVDAKTGQPRLKVNVNVMVSRTSPSRAIPEFSQIYRDKGEKVELKEGARAIVRTQIIPAEP